MMLFFHIFFSSFTPNNVAEVQTNTKSSNKCHFLFNITSLVRPHLPFLIPKKFFQCLLLFHNSFLISAVISAPLHRRPFLRKNLVTSILIDKGYLVDKISHQTSLVLYLAFKMEPTVLWSF